MEKFKIEATTEENLLTIQALTITEELVEKNGISWKQKKPKTETIGIYEHFNKNGITTVRVSRNEKENYSRLGD